MNERTNMNDNKTPATAQAGNSSAKNKKVRLVLNIEDVPVAWKGKKGMFVVVKAVLDSDTIKEIPFIPGKDFASIDEAIAEAGDGLHVVNWRKNAGTYKMLAKSKKYPAPCFMGDWVVEVRGIRARRWESADASGVTFSFVGLLPVSVPEDETPIKFEDLDVVDATGKVDDDDVAESDDDE